MKTIHQTSATELMDRPEWLKMEHFPFRNHFIEIDGHRIHYVDEGNGPVILISHAALSWSFMYRKLIRKLRPNYRIIALDYPGFGLSIPSPNYQVSLENQANLLKRFIQTLQLSSITLLGHDTGGPTGFYLASKHPEWFSGFIATDTLLFSTTDYPRISFMLGMIGRRPFRFLNKHTNLIMRLTLRSGFPTANLEKVEKQAYLNAFDTPEKRDHIIIMLCDLIKNKEILGRVQLGFETVLNKHPMLLLYGKNDPVNKMGVVSRAHQLLPNSSVHLIEEEAHFPHEGRAKEMAQQIHQWMQHWRLA